MKPAESAIPGSGQPMSAVEAGSKPHIRAITSSTAYKASVLVRDGACSGVPPKDDGNAADTHHNQPRLLKKSTSN
ncbi:hypothetical protein CISG_05396 [Coccidioides immitis RMSCC 3703]|uniref:Uncharacterized protein n=1 Tax=Coccidioides immitis RMSCC 3703 TaxID=454286 RepID=A0A0J8QTX3_COCIT|nr:hypothetical protein CISG_05396 [Coccidioides immitis RMSCC 3703]